MAASSVLRAMTQSTRLLWGIRSVPKEQACFNKCFSCIVSPASLVFSRTYSASSFGKGMADDLWQGVTSVSNAGKKRGRGRSVRKRVDLNRGQRIGEGKARTFFPGLTGPALVGKKQAEIHQLQPREGQDQAEGSGQFIGRKSTKIPPLQRGYSGRKYPGTSIGPPDPINDYVFEGFDTKVLEYKPVSHMTGNLGRKMRISVFVVTGNGKGLAGYAVAKAPMGRTALRQARNMAAQRLQYFERYNDHTVFHDFYVKEHRTAILVRKMPKGYGLRCHRVLKTICEVIGIEDMHAKVEGPTNNIQALTKAFFRGLMEQETHQQLADRLSLNVVEFRPDMENIPIVVAKPSQGFTRKEPIKDEAFDYDNMYYPDGRIPLKKYQDPNEKYEKVPGLLKHFKQQHRYRNQAHAKVLRIVYGLEPSKEEYELRRKPLK